jgi:hypothetical protein
MTNKQSPARILVPFTIALMCFWYFDGKNDVPVAPRANVSLPYENSVKPGFRGPASVPQVTSNTIMNHTKLGQFQPAWKSTLEKNLLLQGGGNLKRAEIEKVDSFDWKMGNVPVKVDSLIVKLEHVKGYKSSFRAIVDSSNGKILQTWDHPVNDNFGSKSKADIKIDSRYHND